jgi:hypothetical protein
MSNHRIISDVQTSFPQGMNMSKAQLADRIHRFTLNLKQGHYEWARKVSHKNRESISQFINRIISEERERGKAKTD